MGFPRSHIDTQQPGDAFVNWQNFRRLVDQVQWLVRTEFDTAQFEVEEDATGRYIGLHDFEHELFPFKVTSTTTNEVQVNKGDWVRNGTRLTMGTDVGEDFITLAVPTTAATNHLVILTLSDSANGEDMHSPDTLTASIITEASLDEDERFIVKVLARMENSSGSGGSTVVFTRPFQLWWGGDLGDTPHFFPFEVREKTTTSVFVRGGRWTRNDIEITAADLTVSGFSGTQTEFVVGTLDDPTTPTTLTIARSATNPNGNDADMTRFLLAEVTTVGGAITVVTQRLTGGDRDDVDAGGLNYPDDSVPVDALDLTDSQTGIDDLAALIDHTLLNFGDDDITIDSADKEQNVDHDRHIWFALAAGASDTAPIGFGTQDLNFHTTGECQADDFKLEDDEANNLWNAEQLRIDVTTTILLEAAQNGADAIHLQTTSANSTLHIDADGTTATALDVDSAGGVSITAALNAADAVDIQTTGASSTLHLDADGTGGSALDIDSAGGMDIDAVGDIDIASASAAGTAITLLASAGGMDIDALGTIAVDAGILNLTSTVADLSLTTALDLNVGIGVGDAVIDGNPAIDTGNFTHGWLTTQHAAITPPPTPGPGVGAEDKVSRNKLIEVITALQTIGVTL